MAYGLWKSGAEVVAPHINLSQGLGSGPVRDGSSPLHVAAPGPWAGSGWGRAWQYSKGTCVPKRWPTEVFQLLVD